MKNIKSIIVSAILIMAVFMSTSFAQQGVKSQVKKGGQTQMGSGKNFVDKNGDGICDTYDGTQKGNGTGVGLRDGSGQKTGKQGGQGKGYGRMQNGNTGSGTGTGTGVCDATGPKGFRGKK